MAYQKIPPESFFDKAMRHTQHGVEIMGTLKGAYEGVRTLYGGLTAAANYARPLLALM